jgi:radical SAM protein with 4Fe4S-binding SPASM domain
MGAPMSISELQYGDFSTRVNDKSFDQGIPTMGHFELTFKCALKCVFCYCTPYTSPEHTQHEVTTEEAIRILDQVADAGCLWMTFSGGDPFIRPDFMQIYDHAISRGIIPTILCSGLIVTDEWLEHFKKYPPFKIELPLYGITKETYEATAGKKNTFERAMANIRKLVEAGLPVLIKSKILSLNVHEVPAIQAFVQEELGLEFNPNWFLYPRLDGTRDHLAFRLNPLEVRKLEAVHGEISCDSSTPIPTEDETSPPNSKAFSCAAGINSFYINPYGELNFCTYVRQSSYDLRTGTLKEGMRKLQKELLDITYEKSSACGSCSIKSSCQNCPGHAVLETGSLTGKSDYLCEVNHTVRGKAL